MTYELRPAPKPKVRKSKRGRSSSSLTRQKGLKNRTPMKQRNAKRGGAKFPKRRDPEYMAWIRTLPCLIAGLRRKESAEWSNGENWHEEWWHECKGRVQAAHVKSRGAGGDDVGNVLPLCARAHHEQHTIGMKTWAKMWGYRDIAGLEYQARKLAALRKQGVDSDWKQVYAVWQTQKRPIVTETAVERGVPHLGAQP